MDRVEALVATVAGQPRVLAQLPAYADDKAFVLDVLRRNGDAGVLPHVSERLRDDREVVLAQIQSADFGGIYLSDASSRLQHDRELLLVAAAKNGCFLEKHTALRADREMVLAAMRGGNDLKWVDPALRGDREIAMLANEYTDFYQNAFLYMPPHLRDDLCVQLCAVHRIDAHVVDAHLTMLERTVRDCLDVLGQYRCEYEYVRTGRFTADQVPSLFACPPNEFTRDECERIAACLNTHGLDTAADLVQSLRHGFAVGETVPDSERQARETEFRDLHACLDPCLQRLKDVDEGLPHVAAAIERRGYWFCSRHSATRRKAWIARVEALAAELHAPHDGYAQLAHKRSYEDAFA